MAGIIFEILCKITSNSLSYSLLQITLNAEDTFRGIKMSEQFNEWENNNSVNLFREYLRIRTEQPDIDYSGCVEFFRIQADNLGLEFNVYEVVPKKPCIVLKWQGTDPGLPSIMLNSHMDVVPVYESHWTYPPFEAHMTEDGWIYARGVQDMKCVGILHLEAVRRLKEAGKRFRRTILITYVPDEEIGSADGMQKFVDTEEFRNLNVGCELDEAAPEMTQTYLTVFYGERTTLQLRIVCEGDPSHGSFLPSSTAGEKICYMINMFMTYRARQKKMADDGKWLGEVTSVNLTELEGGVEANVIPKSLSAVFDIRVAPDVNINEFIKMVEVWCSEAGEGVTIEYIQKGEQIENTQIKNNIYYDALKGAIESGNLHPKLRVCPASTDARFIRSKGISAFGVTPIINSPTLLHCHNEKLNVKEFLKGIDLMEKIVAALADC